MHPELPLPPFPFGSQFPGSSGQALSLALETSCSTGPPCSPQEPATPFPFAPFPRPMHESSPRRCPSPCTLRVPPQPPVNTGPSVLPSPPCSHLKKALELWAATRILSSPHKNPGLWPSLPLWASSFLLRERVVGFSWCLGGGSRLALPHRSLLPSSSLSPLTPRRLHRCH